MTKRPLLTHDQKALGLCYIGMIPLAALLSISEAWNVLPSWLNLTAGFGYAVLFSLTLTPGSIE